MKIGFIRHGESTSNAGVPTYDLAKIELTELGCQQAAAVAAAWKETPTLIATSPFLRTQLTAQPTVARFPRAPVDVLPMEEFTYLVPSRWNGTARSKRLPHINAFWSNADPTYCDGPGAESFDTLLARIHTTFERLSLLPHDSLVYAFSHGQFMQAVRLRLTFPRWISRQLMARFWSFDQESPLANCAQLVASRTGDMWTLAPPVAALPAEIMQSVEPD